MEVVIIVGALLVSFLVFTWLLKVARATFSAAITIALILLVLQVLFGIGPETLLEQIKSWLSNIGNAGR